MYSHHVLSPLNKQAALKYETYVSPAHRPQCELVSCVGAHNKHVLNKGRGTSGAQKRVNSARMDRITIVSP